MYDKKCMEEHLCEERLITILTGSNIIIVLIILNSFRALIPSIDPFTFCPNGVDWVFRIFKRVLEFYKQIEK